MRFTKPNINHSSLWIFILSLAIIHGVSFHVMDITNISEIVDCQSYIGLSQFDFHQYVVRKYRIIVPFIASGINFLFGGIFQKLAPWSFPGDFGLSMSFLIVNNLIMAYAGVLLYYLIMEYTKNKIASIIGLVSMLTCRWTGFLSGLPLVDSFYFLVLLMMLLGLKKNDHRYVIASIFLGPWAKEAFIFVAPIIFFYSSIPKRKQIILFAISGTIIFSSRYIIDVISNGNLNTTITEDFDHFNNIIVSTKRLLSFHGLYEIFSVTGFWILLTIFLFRPNGLSLFKKWGGIEYWFIASIFFQAILSTEIARMLFLLTPILAILWATIINQNFISKDNSITI